MLKSMWRNAECVDLGIKCAAKPVNQELARIDTQQKSLEFMRLYRRKRIASMTISHKIDQAVSPIFVHRHAA